MRVLALDTTAWLCSLALWEDGTELSYQEEVTEKSQAAILPTLVNNIVEIHKIDLILVNIGPGSFTGIRVGLAFAKGLAKGLDIPLRGMDSFTITHLANGSLDNVLILIEAHRQDVFAKRYQNGIPEKLEYLTLEDIKYIMSKSPDLLITGTGTKSILKNLPYAGLSEPLLGARALAHAYFINPGKTMDPLPYYAREADVTYRNQTS